MSNPDIRWEQRLANYPKALAQLKEAVQLSQQRPPSDLEEQGLIKAADKIINQYYGLFVTLKDTMETLKSSQP